MYMTWHKKLSTNFVIVLLNQLCASNYTCSHNRLTNLLYLRCIFRKKKKNEQITLKSNKNYLSYNSLDPKKRNFSFFFRVVSRFRTGQLCLDY